MTQSIHTTSGDGTVVLNIVIRGQAEESTMQLVLHPHEALAIASDLVREAAKEVRKCLG
ncbi:hypothetical protein [Corynebacterium phocae]|nr:hypothetical protein [Corynebacterium phocae]